MSDSKKGGRGGYRHGVPGGNPAFRNVPENKRGTPKLVIRARRETHERWTAYVDACKERDGVTNGETFDALLDALETAAAALGKPAAELVREAIIARRAKMRESP